MRRSRGARHGILVMTVDRIPKSRGPVVAAVAVAVVMTVLVTAHAALAALFTYGGAEQTYTVPSGVTAVHVVAVGGTGGSGVWGDLTNEGGAGGVVTADVPVSPGETLYVEVGGNGASGGFNGGGASGDTPFAGNGGGASDVRTVSRTTPISASADSRLLVAAGGGGAGYYLDAAGGAANEAAPSPFAGQPGTASGGGLGGVGDGNAACDGAPGSIGAGGTGLWGGGGGGFYGGGSGGGVWDGMGACALEGGGGGGGFDYVVSQAENVTFGLDTTGTPEVTITAPVPVSSSGPGVSGPVVEGQTLSEQHGSWSPTPSAYAYQWLRCQPGGAACSAIAGATGQTYATSTADIGSSIVVQETALDAYGSGVPATSEPTGVIGAPPTATAPPTINGEARQGQTLVESHASWTNAPTQYEYAWQRCTGGVCAPIPDATGQTYVLSGADVGATIRVLESASNSYGTGAVATSAPTSVVDLPLATPRITSTMAWTFRWNRSYTKVLSLVVAGVPVAAQINVHCAGYGCSFVSRTLHRVAGRVRHPTKVSLTGLFRGARLDPGTTITVSILQPDVIAKVYIFTILAGRPPTWRTSCLAPGSAQLGRGC